MLRFWQHVIEPYRGCSGGRVTVLNKHTAGTVARARCIRVVCEASAQHSSLQKMHGRRGTTCDQRALAALPRRTMIESSWGGDGLRHQHAVAVANERQRLAVAAVLQGFADICVSQAFDRGNPIPRVQGT